jgi:hypothetical protein
MPIVNIGVRKTTPTQFAYSYNHEDAGGGPNLCLRGAPSEEDIYKFVKFLHGDNSTITFASKFK